MPNQQAAGLTDFYATGIPIELLAEAKRITAERKDSVSAVFRRALEEYVEEHAKGAAK